MPAEQAAAAFIDTNIWLYAFIDGDEIEKSLAARSLLQSIQPVVSVQIVNEVCVNLIKKAGFSEEQIQQLIDAFYGKYPVIHLDQPVLLDASRLRQRYSLSFWDSIVVASAVSARVNILYTEDLQHGLAIEDSLKIVNPFIQLQHP